MTKFKVFVSLIILFAIHSCRKDRADFAVIEAEKEFDFGKITSSDTVRHTFKIKNLSDLPLKITKIGTSCGCTGAIISDSIIGKNKYAAIDVRFVPKKGQSGNVSNSIAIEANTTPPFIVLYLKGSVSPKI